MLELWSTNHASKEDLMASDIDAEFLKRYHSKPIRAYSHMYADAVRLMDSPDLEAFDIHKEDAQKLKSVMAMSLSDRDACLPVGWWKEMSVQWKSVMVAGILIK